MSNNKPTYAFSRSKDGSIDMRAMVQSEILHEIPPGVYTLTFHEERGLYLEAEADFKLPERIYGRVNSDVERFLRSFEMNDKNLGVMLVGERGSGKTLTLKKLSSKAVEMGMPVILITKAFPGDLLMPYLSNIKQNIVLCFDEFDKTYIDLTSNQGRAVIAPQDSILQLTDGVSSGGKRLIVFTANEEQLISPFLKDRPSRVRYTVRFERLPLDTVVDYVTANLKEITDEHLNAFIHLTLADGFVARNEQGNMMEGRSDGMNFDVMRELVVEMNQFGGTVNDHAPLMMGGEKKSYTKFHAAIFKGDQYLRSTEAKGIHKGSYMGVDSCDIAINIHEDLVQEHRTRENKEGKEVEVDPTPHWFYLSEKDFVSFGDEHGMLMFKQGDYNFVLRYISIEQSMELERDKERLEKMGKVDRTPEGWHAVKLNMEGNSPYGTTSFTRRSISSNVSPRELPSNPGPLRQRNRY